ncbi:uncharacterized protein FIBRA_08415 [Fibroporia radiculosa]|uniref:Cytochrome P450 n=1 Tax=Fibroporia radiculosa TaxID=599839 RepID=J4GHC6_9APHY|nr:uncharacterized protein FIBRA_08415 [Fibroporia radiculosa]CCM06173.1 predicted protein [Fibroporia radiculosa]
MSLLIFAALVLLCVLTIFRHVKSSNSPLPPGPRNLSLIGNTLHMPIGREWITFAQWAKKYGDIMHLSVLGRSIIVLSSPKTISDLLDKRSTIYSDRPVLTMAGTLVGYDRVIPLEPYTPRHRQGRKLMQSAISPRTQPVLQASISSQMIHFLPRLVDSPAHFRQHTRWLVDSIVFQITYAYNISGHDDPLVQLADRVNRDFGRPIAPAAFLVDIFPSLRHIPDWFPGAGFKAIARDMRRTYLDMRDRQYDRIRAEVAHGTAKPSLVTTLIEGNPNPTPEEDDLYRNVVASVYGAGSDTSVSALESFFLIMSRFPHVQKAAQAEIDAVVGRGRLPTFGDRERLPYVDALIKEIYRWNPVVPMSLPHRLMQDDVYEGYHIPAGATVIGNSWAILHDPDLYPDPFDVVPERYLMKQDGERNPDPRAFAFGYGRRVCPGQIIADDTLFLFVASILATFDVGPPLGANGRPHAQEDVAYTAELISHPGPFDCTITPRSADVEKLLATLSVVADAA